MDGISWVMKVHALVGEHYPAIILHVIIKRVWIYFNAYGINWTHMARYRIENVLAGKITPEEAMKEIAETYSKEVKNVPKSK